MFGHQERSKRVDRKGIINIFPVNKKAAIILPEN